MTLVPRSTRRTLAAAVAALAVAGVAVLGIAAGAAGAAAEPTRRATPSASVTTDPTVTGSSRTSGSTGSTGRSSTAGPSTPRSGSTSATPPTDPTSTDPRATDPTPTIQPDRTPPVVVATVRGDQGGGGWYIGDVRITWSVTDAESKITGATGCDKVLMTTDAVARSITCTARSAGGSAETTVIINRDTTPPTILCPVDAKRTQGSVASLEASVVDGASGPAVPTVSIAVPTAALGTVALRLSTADIAGNRASVRCAAEVIPDTSAPVIGEPSIEGPLGNNGWFVGDVTVSFPVSEPDSTLLSVVGCGPEVVATDGTSVTCTATSNGGTSTRTATVARDATGPVIACPTAPSIVQGVTRSLTATVSDPVSGPAALSVSGTMPSGATGPASITLSASDLAGNISSVECGYLVVSDPTPPIIEASIQGPTSSPASSPASSPVSSPVSRSVPLAASGPWYTGPVSVSFAVREDQSVLLSQSGCGTTVVDTDTAGQVITCTATSFGGAQTRSVTVALDATAPVVSCPATPVFVQGSAGKVSATFSDATSGPVALGADPEVDTSSALGLQSVVVSTRDAAGNVGSGTCSYRVIADETTPVIVPTIEGTSVTPGWYIGPVTVSFSVSDPDSPVTGTEGCAKVTVDADTISQVVAVCRATSFGGVSELPITISRDSVAPVLTCLSMRFVQGTAGKATASASDATSGVASESVSQTADTSTPGERTVILSSTDRAGNTSSQRCTYEVVEPKTVSATKLSSTGSDVTPMVLAGVVLALAGSLMTITARRRAHRQSRHRS